MADPIRVLHVEDDADFASVTAEFLERESDRIEVDAATDPADALDRLDGDSFDCVVSDYDMPGMDGVDLLESVREADPEVPFILFTGKGSEEVATEALAKGATDYLQKATGTDQYTLLANRIENAVSQRHSMAEYERQSEILQAALEIADLGVCEVDLETGDIWISEGLIDIVDVMGYEDMGDMPDRMDRETMRAFFHPADRETLSAAVERAIETGTSADLEVRLNTDDEQWVRVRFKPTTEAGTAPRLRGAIQDVTDRKRRERELGRTQRRFEAVFQDPEMLVGVLDRDGRLREANDTSMAYVEADREDVLGEPFHETPWWDDDTRGTVREWIDRAADGDYVTYDADLTGPDGEPYAVEGSIRPVTDDGEVTSLIVSARDITKRESTETERDFFEALVEETTDIITVIDDTGAIAYANPAIERLLGYDPDAVVGEVVADYVHADDRDAVEAWFLDGIRDPDVSSKTREFRIQGADGEWHWLEAEARDRLSSGIEGYVVTSRVVTERKERERELEDYQTIFEGLGESTFVTNADDEYVYVNTAGAEITGYSEAELVGSPADLTYSEADFEEIAEAVVDLATDDDRDVVTFESTIQTKGGEAVPVELTLTVRYDEDGEYAGTVGVVTDVSDRIEIERELARHEMLLELMPDTVAVTDLEGTITDVHGDEHLGGYEVEDLRGDRMCDLLTDESVERVNAVVDDLVESTDVDSATVEMEIETAGQVRSFENHVTVLPPDDGGEIPGTMSVLRDITERKERERELERFETIVEGLGESIFVADRDGEYLHVNTAGASITGYTGEEIVEGGPELLFDDDDIERFGDAIRELYHDSERDVATVEAEMETRSGETVPVEVTQTLKYDERGRFEGVFGVVRDVSERKQTERELERYETLLDLMPDTVVLTDLEGRITEVHGFEGWSGYEYEALTDGHMGKALTEESVERAEDVVADIVRSDETEKATFELTIQTATGDRRPYEAHLTMLPPDDDGEIPGTMSVLRDISDRLEHERKLERQNERLEQFVSITSHDLRNPLNLAKGHLELAATECDTEYHDPLETALDRMERLIEDTLTWARQGATIEEQTPVDLAEVLPACWDAAGNEAASLAVSTDLTVEADRDRLKRLLENLLRNAVEHGGAGVSVTAGTIHADGPDGAATGFYVADDGPGIPAEDREDVFEAGYTTASDGTGFGLAIIGEICDAHGWDVAVTESETGGARFEVTGVDVVDD